MRPKTARSWEPATAVPTRSSTSAALRTHRAIRPGKPSRSRSKRACLNKKPAFAGFFHRTLNATLCPFQRAEISGGLGRPLLFDLGFLVDDVLARPGVVLLHLDLVGRAALVLGGGVELAGAGRGFELDLLAHRRSSWPRSRRARAAL